LGRLTGPIQCFLELSQVTSLINCKLEADLLSKSQGILTTGREEGVPNYQKEIQIADASQELHQQTHGQ